MVNHLHKIIHTPLEETECKIFVDWCKFKKITIAHIPNEGNFKPCYYKKRKALCVLKGIPDYIVLLPNIGHIYIEMKRAKKTLSKVSIEQKIIIDYLNTIPNTKAFVCYGAKEAINCIESILKG